MVEPRRTPSTAGDSAGNGDSESRISSLSTVSAQRRARSDVFVSIEQPRTSLARRDCLNTGRSGFFLSKFESKTFHSLSELESSS